jgi:hypothetical protein
MLILLDPTRLTDSEPLVRLRQLKINLLHQLDWSQGFSKV